jgi:hypothetical protein
MCFVEVSQGHIVKASHLNNIVQFEDVSFATKTLNDLYGNTLGGLIKGGGIRLSYSKNPLGVRTPTSAGSSGPCLQQQQMQSTTLPFSLDAYSSRSSVDNGTSALRRESSVTAPPLSSSYTYMCSPPPRFFSPSVSSSAFGGASAPLANNVSFPRTSNAPQHGLIAPLNNNAALSSFSPFGISSSPHPTIPDQTSSDAHEHHFSHNALSPSNNLEAARAG